MLQQKYDANAFIWQVSLSIPICDGFFRKQKRTDWERQRKYLTNEQEKLSSIWVNTKTLAHTHTHSKIYIDKRSFLKWNKLFHKSNFLCTTIISIRLYTFGCVAWLGAQNQRHFPISLSSVCVCVSLYNIFIIIICTVIYLKSMFWHFYASWVGLDKIANHMVDKSGRKI